MRYEPKDLNVTFREIPECITLPVNIYGCTVHCKECFEKYLWNESDSVGEELDEKAIDRLISENKGIDCFCFMGGMNISELNRLAKYIKDKYKGRIKVAWYTGLTKIPEHLNLAYFDYVKIGGYDSKYGGLNKRTTNQVLYKIKTDENRLDLVDITYEMQENQP